MVSFWPWRRDASSPASFEKTLSTLSKKIATTQTQLDNARATARRMKVLWTLYLSFAYLVYAIVLFLVVGLKNLGPLEWSGMAGGPLVIYVVRTAMTAIFNFRIDTLTARLKDQQTERAKTIQKLKDATKYDSTLELLEKYGGTENKAAKKGKRGSAEDEKSEKGQGPRTPNRTNMPPPPTANIRRGDAHAQPPRSGPNTPQPGAHSPFGPPHQSTSPTNPAGLETSAEFAPNAFGPDGGGPAAHPHEQPGGARGLAPAAVVAGEPHWYDRILDLLLGEDETAAKNRIALVCGRCRLVNGQAPPGARSLADVGVWRCMACGAANGEEQVADEGRRIVEEVV
ncbi:hypothetical protein QBC33DRAFT_439245, partial [Phialemonium atrogriseum]